MTGKLLIFLIVGTLAMGVPILLIAEKYSIHRWKAVLITIALTIVGTVGTYLMYFIENRRMGGLSFYGAVFLVPVVFMAIAPLLRISYGTVMDFCAVGECVMLALMKVHCILGNCCLGRILMTLFDGTVLRFPSRVVEMAVAVLIFAVLFSWVKQGRKRGELFAWYLLLYGSTRFVLNIFREAWVIKETLLPFGNVWSLLSIGIGLLWLYNSKRMRKSNAFS